LFSLLLALFSSLFSSTLFPSLLFSSFVSPLFAPLSSLLSSLATAATTSCSSVYLAVFLVSDGSACARSANKARTRKRRRTRRRRRGEHGAVCPGRFVLCSSFFVCLFPVFCLGGNRGQDPPLRYRLSPRFQLSPALGGPVSCGRSVVLILIRNEDWNPGGRLRKWSESCIIPSRRVASRPSSFSLFFFPEGGCCFLRQVEGVGWCFWASCGFGFELLASSDRGGLGDGLRRVAVGCLWL
jgi:hypothetical protein